MADRCKRRKPHNPSKKNKENHCTVSEDDYLSSSVASRKGKKAGGRCNLRKSMPWNNAYLNEEEGLLDADELSQYAASLVTKSPRLTPHGDRSDWRGLKENLSRGSPSTSDKNTCSSVSKTVTRKARPTAGSKRTLPQGGGCPRTPSSYSQKRPMVMSTLSTNITSKCLKPASVNVNASLFTSQKNVILGAKGSTSSQSVAKVTAEKNLGLSGPLFKVKKGPGNDATSTKPPIHHSGKNINICSVSRPEHASHICQDTSAFQIQNKPSGLRLPTPSLGFFCRSTQSFKDTKACQLPKSGIPSISHAKNLAELTARISTEEPSHFPKSCIPSVTTVGNLKHLAEVRTPHTSTEHVLVVDPVAMLDMRKESSKTTVENDGHGCDTTVEYHVPLQGMGVKDPSSSGSSVSQADYEKELHDEFHCCAQGNFTVNEKIVTLEVKDQLFHDSKKKATPIKCLLNVVPFSEEWIASLEAAGEEILKLKSGAVQNSPQEKILVEPNPWSPVKRGAQDLGPFDCTKCHLPN
ncbi:hypothetical protein QJS04_geneDACA019682 [Acorus gramineus]|uniref:Uncharacterized protein n=1 Tax=Acorus gramineus TaxID=55184 RepID=A0AAV9B310_ACOGR|nr:hypothetical protein QJS04_geneDACA019682 [Acorus gramineus]